MGTKVSHVEGLTQVEYKRRGIRSENRNRETLPVRTEGEYRVTHQTSGVKRSSQESVLDRIYRPGAKSDQLGKEVPAN